MNNLVEQASIWLQSDACRSGNIIERTNAVISKFHTYICENKAEIEGNKGLTCKASLNEISVIRKAIIQILSAFLRGNHFEAFDKTNEIIRSNIFEPLKPGIPLYKCRENGRLFHFSKNEMFHIPYDKRYLVGNQRFSLSGLPCLYLGGSSYICWEELGRKDFGSCNYCGYLLKDNIFLFDLLLPIAITNLQQIRRIVLILACSLAASRDDLFKPEYILPQCVLHSLIYRSYSSHKVFCVRYYSSHLLNGDADYFKSDFENKYYLQRYVNYVFPAVSPKCKGYNEKLRVLFKQTETVSFMHESLLNAERLITPMGTDLYLRSQFGLIDAILDEKLGLQPKRKEGGLVYFDPSIPGEDVVVTVDD